MPVSDDPKCTEKVEEVKAPEFTEAENKEIEVQATRIASERKARIIEAANKKANEMCAPAMAPAPEATPAPVAEPMATPVPAPEATPVPVADTATEQDAAEFGLGQEGGEDKGDPELAGLFDSETDEMAAPVASRTASAKFSGSLPKLGLSPNSTSDELSTMWDTSDL
jgi:hypothetical protein